MENSNGRTCHQYGNVVVDAATKKKWGHPGGAKNKVKEGNVLVDAGTATMVELEVLADAYLKDEECPTTA